MPWEGRWGSNTEPPGDAHRQRAAQSSLLGCMQQGTKEAPKCTRPGHVSVHPVAPFKLKGFFSHLASFPIPWDLHPQEGGGQEKAQMQRSQAEPLQKQREHFHKAQPTLPQDQHLGSAYQICTPLPMFPLGAVLTLGTTNLISLAGSSMRGDILAFSGEPQPLCKEQKLSWVFCTSELCLSLQGHKPRTRVVANSSSI